MLINGFLRLSAKKDASYRLAYVPLGVAPDSCPDRRFSNEQDLARFLVALNIEEREVAAALIALSRHGSYCVYDVRLSEKELRKHGLGTSLSAAPLVW